MRELGIFAHLSAKMIPSPRDDSGEENSDQDRILGLHDMLGALILFGGGIVISFLSAVVECLVPCFRLPLKNKVHNP